MQYYVAYAYNAIGNKDKALEIASTLKSEAFNFEEMPLEMSIFFNGLIESNQ